ncbi:lysine--tRNA ligase, partial [Agathobacter sp.]
MANQNNNKGGQQQDVNQLLKVRREKLQNLQEAGKDPFQITKYNVTHHSSDVKELYNAHEAEILGDRKTPDVEGLDDAAKREVINNDYNERREIMDAKPIEVSIAGRMMFKRVMGKASFCNIQDLKGNIQVYVARDNIGEDSYADFKKSDIGDIYGVKGFAFRTKTGEISIHAEEITLLSKSLQILPEKFHGLTDTDTRYRQRYVDLIMNQESKEVFIKRSQILKEIRNFLAGRDFMEVETPMLVSNAGGAAARPFETHYNALNEDVKLRISLELYLKRLIVGGLERVYEIGRVFRNEGVDTRHNPEFTLMELYQAYTDYEGMMELTESMFRYLAEKVCGSTKISYNGVEIDLGKPFARMTMIDAIKKYAGVDFDQVPDDAAAKKLADEHHIEYEERHKKGDIVNLFFEEYCEKELIQPTFIMDHPIEISPLTKKKPSDPTKVERFELFCNTWEMCNAYSELNDPIDQRERFAAQDANAAAGDDEAEHT